METWTLEDDTEGKRIQSTTSPIWDTALMLEGLCGAGIPRDDDRLRRAADWLKERQLFGPLNDVALYCPDMRTGGGWAFQYDNSWVPDIDDTTAVALSLCTQDVGALDKYWFVCATEWVLGMQNKDGGWSSFDRDCDHEWLHKIPFNDMENLTDPSTADITSRVLELCTLIIRNASAPQGRPPANLVRRAQQAIPGAIRFITSKQEADGSWRARWGVNYVLGTYLSISALASYVEEDGRGPIARIVRQGVLFLNKLQHDDGGWGEIVASYDMPPPPKGHGPSLPSTWLVREQTDLDGAGGASWPEWHFTGVGFPGKRKHGKVMAVKPKGEDEKTIMQK
ncbi:MAG: hypothetical protein Q9180_006719 [Flavoplaca navasiana]